MDDIRPLCSRITPELFVGGCPETPAQIRHIKLNTGVHAVITLQTPEDRTLYQLDWPRLQHTYREEGIRLFEFPIVDRDEPSLTERLTAAVAYLDNVLQRFSPVLLHCNIGNGRSPTVAVAWMAWRRGWEIEAAAQHAIQCRRCEPNLRAIELAKNAQAAVDTPSSAAAGMEYI